VRLPSRPLSLTCPTVTGIVGAAGGLGGFAPPLVMGFVYGYVGNYKPGLALLAVVAAVYTALGMRSGTRARRLR
jgi:MFS transporter, NNP family, nitrate/nitrite transporter